MGRPFFPAAAGVPGPRECVQPVLIVATYRDVEVTRQHPLSQTLASLISGPHLRVHLQGLTQPEVTQLYHNTTGASPSSSIAETIHLRTEGNPQFVNEVIWALQHGSPEAGQQNTGSVPQGIRDAIGRWLNGLSDECNRVLATASVALAVNAVQADYPVPFRFVYDLAQDLAEDGSWIQLDDR